MLMNGHRYLTAMLFASLTLPVIAQQAPLAGSLAAHPQWPAAKKASDVDTPDHLMASLYDVISGPAGKARDWDRFRSLFLPEGRLGVIRPDSSEHKGDAV